MYQTDVQKRVIQSFSDSVNNESSNTRKTTGEITI
jgi:hypothetical protein